MIAPPAAPGKTVKVLVIDDDYEANLQLSNEALLSFAHTAAHDLKAPARRMASFCELLREDVGEDRLGADGMAYLARMTVNAERLQNLIDDLLSYSKVMLALESRATIDIFRVLRNVEDVLKPLIVETAAQIDIGPMPEIIGYQSRITQLFQNLLANALKYRGGQKPMIVITCEDLGFHYLFSIQDNGIGIDDRYQESVFNPFERLQSREEIEGSGLGLAICRKAVHMHKGKIWLKSQPGQGTIFYFTIAKLPVEDKSFSEEDNHDKQ